MLSEEEVVEKKKPTLAEAAADARRADREAQEVLEKAIRAKRSKVAMAPASDGSAKERESGFLLYGKSTK